MRRHLLKTSLALSVLPLFWILTAQIAVAQYAATVLADNPVAYYRLNESPGSTVAVDSSGNANNGFYEGSPTLGVTGLIPGSDTAVDFTNGDVVVPDTAQLNFVSAPYTLEAWVKGTPLSTTPGQTNRIWDKALGGFDMGYGYDVALNYVRMFGANPIGNFDTTTSLPSYTVNYVVAVSNGTGTGLIYVNGVLVASGPQIASKAYTGAAHIGAASDGGARFAGVIDEVAVYNYALTATQILAHYEAGTQSSDATAPLVSNVLATPDPVAINNAVTLTATISDATTGGSNIATAQYNINGGSSLPMQATDGAFNSPTETVTASVAPFPADGIYNLCVTGMDSANNTSAPTCVSLPVYDPSAGFVTGGGSIFSPAGKDLVNTSAAGAATFAFVSKYLKGSNTPSGNLEFHFDAGNLHFKSTSMDWLVVTGEPRAQFHGTGTINGTSVCQFAVDAWDNSFGTGSSKVDAFGIKIYSCNSGGNGNGDRYSIDATPLTGGSIIIHK